MLKKRFSVYLLFSIFLSFTLPAQEALKSIEEEYYDFLSLQGLTERPALNYRTLSDSVWTVDENATHPWQEQNLGTWRNLFGDFRIRVYGPELFMSANTAAPYGQNDGVLWQGRGFNALFKSGVRFEGYGVELTLLPHFAFSQNAPFEIMPSYYESEYGYFWGYGVPKSKSGGADAPQRFGDKPFFDWDFGDSEIRYTWKTLTIGFGTQAIWLGPSYLNPMLHSNNAPAYPKFDIGLRRQRVTIPWLDWYLGDVEARLWVGRLSKSDYFDSDPSNDYTMFHGFAFAYAPSFLPGLTLFANRVCLVPWEWENLKYIFPSEENTIEDQKASFGFSWIFPQVGFEVYGELGIDDFVGGGFPAGYIRYPFHTMVYTGGVRKTVAISKNRSIYGMITAELNSMEMSQDFQYMWPYSFYFHHQVVHGYTNRGQWIGAGTGWGGNSQYMEFKLCYPTGTSSFFLHRNNPDNNYFYSKTIEEKASETGHGADYFWSWKANFVLGLLTEYFITNKLILGGGVAYNLIMNPYYYTYKSDVDQDEYMHNFSFQLKMKYQF
jgi:hypothetical protein